jgi:hypothetical protein
MTASACVLFSLLAYHDDAMDDERRAVETLPEV